MAKRIKGQEVSIAVMVDNQVQLELNFIKSFEFTYKMDLLSEGYLGQTSEKKDSIFKGIGGKLEFHFAGQDVLLFADRLKQKAQRRTPGMIVNVKATLKFDNGQTPRVIIPDCEFGEVPVNFGSRADFGSMSLAFEAEDVRLIAA